MMRGWLGRCWWAPRVVVVLLLGWHIAGAAPIESQAEPDAPTKPFDDASVAPERPSIAESANESVDDETPAEPGTKLVRLDPKAEVWVDAARKRVIVGGRICLRKGLLEMFACPRGTKEHESVVAVNSKSYLVHTALLAIGAKPGSPVQYDPVYKSATGAPIRVEVIWKDEQGNVQRRLAQDMVRHVKTREAMTHAWVFSGSGFWEDEKTNERFYMAEGGELICLSNFSTATMDLPVESSRDNADLLYEAYTENIPPLETSVRLVLSVADTPEEATRRKGQAE